jgi:hypothetical protein
MPEPFSPVSILKAALLLSGIAASIGDWRLAIP